MLSLKKLKNLKVKFTKQLDKLEVGKDKSDEALFVYKLKGGGLHLKIKTLNYCIKHYKDNERLEKEVEFEFNKVKNMLEDSNNTVRGFGESAATTFILYGLLDRLNILAIIKDVAFNTAGTETKRVNTSELNLTNVPKEVSKMKT